jgi:di/tricarboxylate transporter
MNPSLLIVLSILAAAVALFTINKPRMDVVALLVIVLLPLTGILTVPETLAGFSDANVVLIALLFVIGEGLVRTGVAYQVGDLIIHHAGKSESRLIVLLMLAVAGLGSVMSSTGVVAIFIPVVLSIGGRLGIPMSRLMMPLSFAGLISGMLTLVATPPNMVVDSALRQDGQAGFRFFSFTPIGCIILAAGVIYMLFARRWLNSAPTPRKHTSRSRRSLIDLVREYDLSGREYRMRVLPHSPLIGKALKDIQPRRKHRANVVAIERSGKLQKNIINPTAHTELLAGDILFVDVPTPDPEEAAAISEEFGLAPLPLKGGYFTDQSREVGMVEVIIPPGSGLIGKSIVEAEFRSEYQLHVIGLRSGSTSLQDQIMERKLKAGDMLLLIGPWKAIRKIQADSPDLLVLTLPTEIDEVVPASRQAPLALASLLVMVALMVSGLVPNVLAALIGCLLMGLFRCIDMSSAYRSIHWQSLILIVGVMPFATALQKTGGIDLAVSGLIDVFGKAEPRVLLGSLFVFTAVIGLFISNTATAVLMAPIALSVAAHIGASPYPFAMTVALAASAAFMTPISSPVNTLVLGPGQYRFGDFVRVGVPFTIIVLLISVLVVPLLFPFR